LGKEDYDNLNQLVGFTRGSHNRSWDYDAQGNWQSVTTDGSTQRRTHNAQNEITSISGAVTPTYDANGNLTGDETGRQLVFDAWNRLVEVKDSSGNLLKRYAYDGLHRRVQETAGGVTTDLYYSDAWQVLEERVGNALSSPLPVGEGSGVRVQHIWSPVYVDALILRDRDTNGDGTLDERRWVVQDANYNVTALLDNSGNVVERYVYDPFGSVTVLDTNWTERPSGSQYAWRYLHQGGRFDATSGLYHFRYRDYSPTPGRWTSLDPLRYDAGDVNLYRVVFNAPTNFTDPSGNIPIIPFVAAGAIAGWWLLGPGAGTANAPAPSQEILRPLPRSLLEDAVAGLPGALAGGGIALAGEAAVVVGGTILRRPRPGGVPNTGGWAARLRGKDLQIMQEAAASTTRNAGFMNHLEAVAQATAMRVPGGKVHLIGRINGSPVFGSLVSGTGIVEINGVTMVVRKTAPGVFEILGPFIP
jgi:RHS repeat-associated protein